MEHPYRTTAEVGSDPPRLARYGYRIAAGLLLLAIASFGGCIISGAEAYATSCGVGADSHRNEVAQTFTNVFFIGSIGALGAAIGVALLTFGARTARASRDRTSWPS